MKVLMFGWEFPPFNKGGLGTACYGLTKGLNNQGVEVTFVLPKAKTSTKDCSTHVNLILAKDYYIENTKIKFHTIDSILTPYATDESYSEHHSSILKSGSKAGSDSDDDVYGGNLYQEVERFAQKAKLIAAMEDFDVIHAHDWMTYKAGILAKEVSGKPLVIHVHATEFDRTGDNPNNFVYDLERMGMHGSDRIITVSNLTKNRVIEKYGVNPQKIDVVHNAVTFNDNTFDEKDLKFMDADKVVLFLGRITIQKGPDYFVESAKRVIDYFNKHDKLNVKFIFAGSGDMEQRMIHRAAELGISDKMLFAGWVRGKEIDRLYSMADLYVMPSVSEPFGITPLEAMRNGTPCLISKQSGVSEVVSHCLKVDFWDIDEMTNKIVSVLKHSSLHHCLKENGVQEVKKFDWDIPAKKCLSVYNKVLGDYHFNIAS
jgi:glycogen(starch) synthase